MMPARPDADVLVVGGGPVGLAAAIEARLAGMTAIVLEPRTGDIDKACGEGLMPGALPELARLGVDPEGMPFAGIVYRDARHRVEHRFAGGPGRGVRRTTLHRALRSRAADAGVRIEPVRVSDESVSQDADGVTAGGIRGRWGIGADGLHSTVARSVGLARPAPTARRRYGVRRHFEVEPWSEFVEVHWTPVGELYVTPVAPRLVGIALLGPRGGDVDAVIASVPELAGRVAGAAVGERRGAGPFRQRTTARVAGRVLLAGDASGYVDALTGEGQRIGFAQARAAIAAIRSGDPQGYEREWERVTRDFRRLTAGLVRVAASPLRGAVVPLAARLPGVFAAAVERLAR